MNTLRNRCVTHAKSSSSDSDDVYTDEHAFALQDSADTSPVTINGITVGVIIDSGASCNIINSAVSNQLRDTGSTFHTCRRLIHPYESPPIECKEYLTANIAINGVKPVSADFLVVPGTAPPLLGKATAQQLGILKVGINHVSHEPSSPDNLFAKYPGLCEGISCLKDTEVMLHIDKSVPPVASKHSHTPFHMRDKVAREIEHLEKQGVIEKVSGPTGWVSRIVTPPKPKSPGEIRLCVDMRDANRAILRTRHITPTIEELTTDLNGATIFSKLDLRSGCHQLLLHPSCRYITTFSTHLGLYQYKRLGFGINAAAENFQHMIQTVITDTSGTKNISDDIVVYGKDQSEHDQALDQTLQRLHQSGLTDNPQKCEFNKPSIELFGHVFSKDGITPAPSKVQALHDAVEPQNQTELRSFLGMAQYGG